ncbi:MAG: hypothetical protein IPL46_19490 [Saprospiraceae bacterium]|nr:hypothetical protein [Saprospiraceae bacterium]
MKSTNFIVAKSELLQALKSLQKIERVARKKSTLEVTLIEGYLELSIPGAQLKVSALTKGGAKFTSQLWYYNDFVKSASGEELCFTLVENGLNLGRTTILVKSIFLNQIKYSEASPFPLITLILTC